MSGAVVPDKHLCGASVTQTCHLRFFGKEILTTKDTKGHKARIPVSDKSGLGDLGVLGG
jgi:hypothetical protein